MKTRIALFLTLLFTVTAVMAQGDIGKPAPAFEGKDINGKTHKLGDYKGKVIVFESINLDCPFSLHHYKTGAMQELQAEAAAKDVAWLVVNSVNDKHSSYRSPEKAKKEWKEHNIRAAAWIDDSSGKIGKAYGLKTTPHMIVISKDGTVAYNGAIDDNDDGESDPRKARNYVREAINALESGKKVEVTQTRPYGCGIKYGK